MIHHLPDRRSRALALARSLRPDGVVVRTTFREHPDAVVYHRWPALRATEARRFPGRCELLDDVTSVGFSVAEVLSFAKFTHLTEREFREGLDLLEADATIETSAGPTAVCERHDVAVSLSADTPA